MNAKNEKDHYSKRLMDQASNKKRRDNHTETRTATHGRPSLVQVAKIFGAFLCTANPYRTRDPVKTKVFAADKVDVTNTALTMEGRTAWIKNVSAIGLWLMSRELRTFDPCPLKCNHERRLARRFPRSVKDCQREVGCKQKIGYWNNAGSLDGTSIPTTMTEAILKQK